jgi:pantetheine-phosphate adenylyltransferase
MKTGIYAGTFDPITLGHLDIATRGMNLFDRFIIAVAEDSKKQTTFSLEERVKMIRKSMPKADFEVISFKGLLVNFAGNYENPTLVRGLRALSDFEYEFQMALTNKHQHPEVETLFLVTRMDLSFVSSSVTKELARLGGKLDGIVPDNVKKRLEEHFTHPEID